VSAAQIEVAEVLVTVKAYPCITRSSGESVCVAGVRIDTPNPELIRLYPVPFRDLSWADRFAKYQIIKVPLSRTANDGRPESWRPDVSAIELGRKLEPRGTWTSRRPFVEPLIGSITMCGLQRQQAVDGTSLGIIEPVRVEDFTVEPNDEFDAVKQALAEQAAGPTLLYRGRPVLEAAPYKGKYHYRCGEHGCRGHHQTLVDWEFAQAGRDWDYPDEATMKEKLRERFLDSMCGPDRETHFFVGNQWQARRGFLVLGIWTPKRIV
jgi:hypothetical protein